MKNQVLAAGERVLGKIDSFTPVVFYLCKNGQGDLCTPWALAYAQGRDGGQSPGADLASKIVMEYNKKINRGSVPRPEWTSTGGFINIRLSDSYILQTVNELAADFQAELYKNVRPDSETESFLEDYITYLAVNYDKVFALDSFEGNLQLRQLGVLIVYAHITGNMEMLKLCLYKFISRGSVPCPGIVRAAAQVFAIKRQEQ